MNDFALGRESSASVVRRARTTLSDGDRVADDSVGTVAIGYADVVVSLLPTAGCADRGEPAKRWVRHSVSLRTEGVI